MREHILEIDLHLADTRVTRTILTKLIDQAEEERATKIRIIHGKGKSQKKLEVYKILEADNRISGYDDEGSNWGVTIAELI